MSATVKLFIMLNVGAFVSATLKPIPVKGNYRVEQSLEKWSQDGDKMVISSKRFSIFDVTSRMDDSGCIACKNIVTELAQRVDKNLSEQEIRAGLAQMCTYLPTAKCTSFVETYEGPIVDFFLHKVDPTKICSEIGACKPLDITITKPIWRQVVEHGSSKILQATVCDYIISNGGVPWEIPPIAKNGGTSGYTIAGVVVAIVGRIATSGGATRPGHTARVTATSPVSATLIVKSIGNVLDPSPDPDLSPDQSKTWPNNTKQQSSPSSHLAIGTVVNTGGRRRRSHAAAPPYADAFYAPPPPKNLISYSFNIVTPRRAADAAEKLPKTGAVAAEDLSASTSVPPMPRSAI
ncbi:Prosaposin [Folsomia candida]|uniref:Prosaposin n=1 Tax=Folsomia candida TaxID=158441 RepID=A0A226D3Y7_FOLCA|nr:Prosaposin [Folsomia candida]